MSLVMKHIHTFVVPARPLYLDEKSGKPTRYNVYREDLREAINGSRDFLLPAYARAI